MRQSCVQLTDISLLEDNRTSLIVPTQRHADELRTMVSQMRLNKGQSVWQSPKISAVHHWLSDAYRRLGDEYPDLAPHTLISNDAFLLIVQERAPHKDIEMHARALTEAWELVWNWNLWSDWQDATTTDNGRQCVDWFARIQRYLKRESLITLAEVPSRLVQAIERNDWRPEKTTWLNLGDTPRGIQQLQQALNRVNLYSETKQYVSEEPATYHSYHFSSVREELASAVFWARNKLSELGENANICIAVDYPAFSYNVLKRQFESVLFEVSDISELVHFANGQPFTDTQLYQDFTTLLKWTCEDVPYKDLLALAKSPYFPKLNLYTTPQRFFKENINIQEYSRRLKGAEGEVLRNLVKHGSKRTRTPQAFTESVQRLMRIIQHTGYSYREIEPLAYVDQNCVDTLAKLLDQVTKLGGLFPRISWVEFINLIDLFAREQSVRQDNRITPIQVMPKARTKDLHFDALWLTGMADDDVPTSPKPNPFVPISMQKRAHLPKITHEQMLEETKELIKWWEHCATEVVFSYANKDDEVQANLTELLSQELDVVLELEDFTEITSNEPELIRFTHPWSKPDPEQDYPVKEYLQESAPTLKATDIEKPRTSLLSDIAKCQFRGWAIHRAKLPEPPTPTRKLPEALERGSTFHYVVEELIHVGMTNKQIGAIREASIDEAIETALKRIQKETGINLPKSYLKQENKRLHRLTQQFLEYEAERPGFKVHATEESVTFQFEELSFTGRIDRIDTTKEENRLIIDYKTGKSYSPKKWDPEKFEDPQMPVYATSIGESDGIAFYTVHRDQVKLEGSSTFEFKQHFRKKFVHMFGDAASFEEQKSTWYDLLRTKVKQFLDGCTDVNPVTPDVCKYCHLQNTCRIWEENPILDEDEQKEQERA